MSMGTQVALIMATIVVFAVIAISLVHVAASANATQVRVAALLGLIALFIAGLVGIAVAIDTSCKDPNSRPCVGVTKEEK